ISVINTDNTVSPAGNVSVLEGTSQSFTITAPTGLQIAQVLVDNVNDAAHANFDNPSLATYTFNNVIANHTIEAIYADAIADYTSNCTIDIFPNPVRQTLTITNDKTMDEVVVYDVTGKAVYRNHFCNNRIELDLSNLYSGIYILKITSDNKIYTKKFIKQ
ncbi:MAG: T9SS type A sorting domain-containing protein, partial [Bacteroidales bacterium]|nr:T9SS type A sorting domain-containing protein [Bacteroidales bacterium]